jgi:hypothetical protein
MIRALDHWEYQAFLAAKNYAESVLPDLLVAHAIQEALIVILDNAMLVIRFDPKTERLFIAGFTVEEFDPPTGPAATITSAREHRALVHVVLARLGLAGAIDLVDDERSGNVIAENPFATTAFAVEWTGLSSLFVRDETNRKIPSLNGKLKEFRPRLHLLFLRSDNVTERRTSLNAHQILTYLSLASNVSARLKVPTLQMSRVHRSETFEVVCRYESVSQILSTPVAAEIVSLGLKMFDMSSPH